MPEETPNVRDVLVSEATPAEIAAALRYQGKNRFGDKILMTAGKGYTAAMLADEIEQGTEIGLDMLRTFQRPGSTEKLPQLYHVPTKAEQEKAQEIHRAKMAEARKILGIPE